MTKHSQIRLSFILQDLIDEPNPLDAEGRSRAQCLAERLLLIALYAEDSVALAAAREILDRLEGKAPQALVLDGTVNTGLCRWCLRIRQMSDEELNANIASLQQARQGSAAKPE